MFIALVVTGPRALALAGLIVNLALMVTGDLLDKRRQRGTQGESDPQSTG